MLHTKLAISYLFGVLLLVSCNTPDQLGRYVVNEDFPEISSPHYLRMLAQDEIRSGNIIDGRFLMNYIIEVILHEPKKSVGFTDKADLIKRFERTNTILFLNDSIRTAFSGNFLKFMPQSFGSFKNPVFMTLENNPYFKNFPFYLEKRRRSHSKGVFEFFEYKSSSFPETFRFPIDIVDYSIYGTYTGNYPKFGRKDYLILELPSAIILHTTYTEDALRFRRNYSVLGVGTPTNFHPVFDSTGYYRLAEKQLLLNPAFTKAYSRSVKSIWELYLIKVKYEYLNDTVVCIDDCRSGNFLGYIFPHMRPYCRTGCPLNLTSQNVLNYLSQAYVTTPLMYKSYFELILWQMYETGDFTPHDFQGTKGSYLFTSNNPKYPGDYEVKFNIYKPYDFKVRKR